MSEETSARRRAIGAKVRELRKARGLSQVELAGRLGVSQGHLSQLERGAYSFTAEQLLDLLRLFNVSVSAFAPSSRDPLGELQNALARFGATHLREVEDVVPSGRYDDLDVLVADTLTEGEPRLVPALAPVLVKNIDRVHLPKVDQRLAAAGLNRRLWWLLGCVVRAFDAELAGEPAVSWSRRCRRARVVIAAYLDHIRQAHDPDDYPIHDIVDPLVRSKATVRDLIANSAAEAQQWNIVTSLQTSDFVVALAEARPHD